MRHFAKFFSWKIRRACSVMEHDLLKVFPLSLVWLIERGGTPQCLALEHRGCANWTSGSVASVQINREAAQESSGAVRGIWEASHPPRHTNTHWRRGNTRKCINTTAHKSSDSRLCQHPNDLKGRSERYALPDRTPRPPDRGATPGRAQLSHSPGTTCLWPHRTAGPGWSPEPWRQREHTAWLEIRLFILSCGARALKGNIRWWL